jgi:transposase, IS30 family
MHRHININDRSVVDSMLKAGYGQKDIVNTLKFSKGAVSKEIRKNSDEDGIYRFKNADKKSKQRRLQSKLGYRKIENDIVLENKIQKKLNPLVSPEVVAHELGIHHQTIYTYIYRTNPKLRKELPYQGRRRRKYGSKGVFKVDWLDTARSIHSRKEQEQNWEGDTVKGSTKKKLLTHIERKSLYTIANLIPDGTADSVHAQMKKNKIKGTITYDRGSEFALWKMIEKDTKATIYFADAYAPQQRGKNENTNGRIRRIFPKGFNFDTINNRQLQEVIHLMNHTPRKTLNWRTPAEVFMSLLSG